MKLLFLGTGAADYDISKYDTSAEFRRFSSALVNDDLLIDPGPHIFHFAEKNGTPDLFANVKNIIVTHTHGDHFCADTVKKLCYGKDVTLWGDPRCLAVLRWFLPGENVSKIKFKELNLREPTEIGGYTVTSLRANHFPGNFEEVPRVYLVSNGERTLFYGLDSSGFPTESWNVIRKAPVNAAVFELTCGETSLNDFRIFEHNTLPMLRMILTTVRQYHYFAPDVKFYTSHMARTLHTDHETLKKTLAADGAVPAYDGMEIEI